MNPLIIKQNQEIGLKLKDSRQSLFLSKEQLDEIRLIKLKSILKFAKENSKWYANTLKHIDVESFSIDRLSEIPVLTKEILMQNWNDIVTDPNLNLDKVEEHVLKMQSDTDQLYLEGKYHVLVTSGTSGLRGVFVYNWDEWVTYCLMFKRYGVRGQNPMVKTKVAFIAIPDIVYGSISLTKTFQSKNVSIYSIPITLPEKELISQLNTLQPDVLMSNPSGILNLCNKVNEGNLKISPKVISVGSEPFYQPIRELILKTWPGVDIYNTFGSTEGVAAINCSPNMHEMHLNDDLCIIEPVDYENKLVKFDMPSNKIFITNLFNQTLPLIRYEIPDSVIFLDKKCECGVAHQLIKEPQARPSSNFIYNGKIQIPSVAFSAPLLYERGITEYQVIQTLDGANIKVVINNHVKFDTLASIISNNLKQYGLKKSKISFFEVSDFKYLGAGKISRFIALS
ncbi:hypothetical protein V6259_18210 [Marinomonas sp. TI.3.20]|uniref:phenylacetate--CoA ligase family protein n=1 Tax=Marinomonas sp. TI.3.20 TaxID=3121296 RepID=UPI00311F191A